MNRRRSVVGCCIALLAVHCGHGQHGGGATSAAPHCEGVRPPGTTGKGFFTKGSTIYDGNGCPFIPMGFSRSRLAMRSRDA
jgi:hypothetical protein